MCLVLLAFDSVPGYPVVLAANREERHARPTAPLHWWPERPWLAGGRDRLAGGTWLGVRRDGRFATVLNAPGSPAPGARSRGELVPDFLAAADADRAAAALQASSPQYGPFHFLGSDLERAWYAGGQSGSLVQLGAGLHAADRGGLDPAAPRVARARELFAAVADAEPRALLALLADEEVPRGATGDRRPVFLRGADFGTRCSTVLRISAEGEVQLIEHRFGRGGRREGETQLAWQRQSITATPE